MPEATSAPDLALLTLLDPDGRFRARLAEDRRTVEVLRRALSSRGRTGRSARLDLEPLAHRLAGAAGTFGFAEVSATALDVEDILVDGRTTPSDHRALDAAAERLQFALAAAVAATEVRSP